MLCLSCQCIVFVFFSWSFNDLVKKILILKSFLKICIREFLLWLSRLGTWLVSMRIQIWSLALLSGSRIWCCGDLWHRPAAEHHSTPRLETSICCRCSPKKQKKEKNLIKVMPSNWGKHGRWKKYIYNQQVSHHVSTIPQSLPLF